MNYEEIKTLYYKNYESINFERTGLFQFIGKNYSPGKIIYPGSSIHITPSFIFPRITYMDKSSISQSFFSQHKEMQNFINSRKKYKEKASFSYIHADYTKEHQNLKEKFDMAFCIYAPATFRAAEQFLKKGGVLIYLPLPSEKETPPPSFEYVRSVFRNKKGYFFKEEDPSQKVKISRNMKGKEFIDKNIYKVFRLI